MIWLIRPPPSAPTTLQSPRTLIQCPRLIAGGEYLHLPSIETMCTRITHLNIFMLTVFAESDPALPNFLIVAFALHPIPMWCCFSSCVFSSKYGQCLQVLRVLSASPQTVASMSTIFPKSCGNRSMGVFFLVTLMTESDFFTCLRATRRLNHFPVITIVMPCQYFFLPLLPHSQVLIEVPPVS